MSFTEVCAKVQFKKTKSTVEKCLSLFEELNDDSPRKLSLELGLVLPPSLRE